MVSCRVCERKLTKENWYSFNKRNHEHICKTCQSKRMWEWQKSHGRKNTKKYMKEYMRSYRQRHLKKMQELGRIEQYRRHRELSTDIILNNHFDGSQLHHLTPSVAAYIPSELHRSIPHNLKTGINMEKINDITMNWLACLKV